MVFAVRVRPESTDRGATPGTRRRPWVPAAVLATTVLISGLIAPLGAEAAAGTGSISGTVVGADAPSVGLGGADVNLTLAGGTVVANAETAADGSYSFSGLQSASYVVSVQQYPSEYLTATSTPIALAAGQSVSGIIVTLPVGGAIAGTITKDGGAPVSGAYVESSEGVGSATTGADGSYRLAGLTAGVFTVHVTLPYGSPLAPTFVSNVSVTLGSTTTTSINLADEATIAGVVTGPGGSPVNGATVVATSTDGDFGPAATTGADGSYVIHGLAADTYTLEFEQGFPGGYLPQWWSGASSLATAQAIVVGAGASLTGYNAQLVAGASISGTVTDPANDPLVNVQVEAHVPGQEAVAAYAFTDFAGHYALRGLTAGDYVVSFDADAVGNETPQWWSASSTAAGATVVHVAATESRTGVDAHLTAGGTISGTISGKAATGSVFPAANSRISVYRADGSLLTDTIYVETTGAYQIPNLLPGSYTLRVDPRPDLTDFQSQWYLNGSSQATATPITVTADATTNIDMTLPSTTVASGPTNTEADTSYVKALYQDFLGRTPNASEIGFWTDALSIGLPRTSIAAGFVTSDEYRLIRIDDAYQSVLGRASDAQGRQWWLAAVKAGSLQIDDVAEHFYSSQEYVDAHQGNGESNVTRNWIHQLYTDLLHRAPDASGLNFWEAATVANGRQSVVDGFWNSQETAGARVSAMYASYLGRTPDPDGLVFWTHVDLTLGDSVTRSSITASDEYYNLATTRYPASSPGTGAV